MRHESLDGKSSSQANGFSQEAAVTHKVSALHLTLRLQATDGRAETLELAKKVRQ
jgi:hypothetical protein